MIRTRKGLALAAAAAITLVVAACGGDDSGDSGASGGSDTTEATDAGSDTTAATDSTDAGSDSTEATGDTVEDTGGDDGDDDGGTAGDDSCQVDVTGDTEASWTGSGGQMAVNTDYWLTEAQKEMFGDSFYFIVNCQGDDGGYLGILAGNPASAETIPYGPGTYAITPGGSIAGNVDDPLAVMLTVPNDDGVYSPSEPGTIEITAFDDDHIAGTVSFTAESSFTDTPRTIQVEASFDFDNPN